MYNNKTIIQIGSHIGDTRNDLIFKEVNKTSKLILVEPVPYLFKKLKENYDKKEIDDIIYINKAVSSHVGNIELTIPSEKNDFSKFPFWASQLSSVNENHIKNHQSKGKITNLIVEKIKVPTTTLDKIIEDYNLKEIELIQTDTEGHDYDILFSYSFKIKPKKILFEHKHLDLNLHEKLKEKLKSLSYKLEYSNKYDSLYKLGQNIKVNFKHKKIKFNIFL